MMKKHRTLSLTLAAVMALGLLSIGGCGKKTDTKPKTGDNGVPTAYAEQDYGFQLEQPTRPATRWRSCIPRWAIFLSACSRRQHPRRCRISLPMPKTAIMTG